jgi:hypothetical protein
MPAMANTAPNVSWKLASNSERGSSASSTRAATPTAFREYSVRRIPACVTVPCVAAASIHFLRLYLYNLPAVASRHADDSVTYDMGGDCHFRSVEIRRDLLGADGSGELGIARVGRERAEGGNSTEGEYDCLASVLSREREHGGYDDDRRHSPPRRRAPCTRGKQDAGGKRQRCEQGGHTLVRLRVGRHCHRHYRGK